MTGHGKTYLLELLASAETPEEIARVEALVVAAEEQDEQTSDRIPLQKEAARILGVARVRLRDWELNSPWWKPEFRTDEGYDIAAITAAQVEFSGGAPVSAPGENWLDRQKKAKALQGELELEEMIFEAEKRRGNILPADVYASYSRELLGMIRKRLEEIPLRVARNASPAGRAVVYNPKGNAPLQREIEKLITDVEEWLKKPPEGDENAAN